MEFYGVDLEQLQGRIGKNPKIIHKILSKFCEDYGDVEQIFNLSQMDTDSFQKAIHTLKGVSGNISLNTIYQLSKSIHDTHDIALKRELIPKLITTLKETVQQLKTQLDIA